MNACRILLLTLLCLTGCAAVPSTTQAVIEPEDHLRELCDQGKYHQAMRELPGVMNAWQEYTAKTGNSAEGSAGYIYQRTMDQFVAKGAAQWGQILDDPAIPHVYKTEMIFEILEAHLGKGSVYMGNDHNFIIPREAPIDLKNMIKLPN